MGVAVRSDTRDLSHRMHMYALQLGQISAISPPHDHCMCTRQFSHRSRCSSCAAALSALYLAPPRHRIPDLFSFLHRIMSRVILLIVCALSVASCLVVQTGAMRSAGERPPQSRWFLFLQSSPVNSHGPCDTASTSYICVRVHASPTRPAPRDKVSITRSPRHTRPCSCVWQPR